MRRTDCFADRSPTRGQLVDAKTLENRFEQLGLAFERPIVIVHEGSNNSNFGAAARVYWTLKSSGFSDLSILNGGKRLWEKEGFPLQTDSSIPTPTELEIAFSIQWMKTTQEIGGIADDGGGARLVDARTPQFYEGARKHDAAARPGTIPGAVNYVHSSFFDGDSPLIKRTVNASLLKKELGIEEGADVVSFCNTGHWAATNWFAFSEIAGIENVKLYPGSMVEYSQADLPMTNTPGILKNVLRQVGIGN